MRQSQIAFIATILSLISLVAGCTPTATEAIPTAVPVAPTATIAPTEAPTAEPTATSAPESPPAGLGFDPANFAANSAEITNQWFPLKPGTRFVYEGTTVEDDGTLLPHRVEINVTDLTKEIGGVLTRVTWDLDYSDGELAEAELAFFAQDTAGTVWRVGEYPEEYEAGNFIIAPAWIHGIQEAAAGTMMPADPQLGSPSYAEGWGPAVDWTDRGQVDQMGVQTCVKLGCYENVLVIAETSASEPDAFQLKHYAPNVGNVYVGWRGEGEKTQEVLELVEITELDAAGLEAVRTGAWQLEQHGYEVSKLVYALTTPLILPPGVAAPQVAAEAPAEGAADAPSSNEFAVAPGSASEIVVYTSELPEDTLYEMEVWDDAEAVGGKMLGVTNYGDELDPPPENDPNATFPVTVENGVKYRCWIHMKVGEPDGRSTANVIYVQFSDTVDEAGADFLRDGSETYLIAQGPTDLGWHWIECALPDDTSGQPPVLFDMSGEVEVRVQAGMEGVGFDQFILSAAEFLNGPPEGMVVEK